MCIVRTRKSNIAVKQCSTLNWCATRTLHFATMTSLRSLSRTTFVLAEERWHFTMNVCWKTMFWGFTRSSALMGFDLCVLWRVVSLINLKMTSMLAFDKRYLRRNSTSVISTCLHAMVCSFSHVCFHFVAFLNGQTLCWPPFCFGLMTD